MKKHPALIQVCFAVVLAAICYAVLIAAQDRMAGRGAFRQEFFGQWTQYVCILLAFWALGMLFAKWRRVKRRALVLAKGLALIPDPQGSEQNAGDVTAGLRQAANEYGDDFLAVRAEVLVSEFQVTGDRSAVAAALSFEWESALADLESDYAPVRILCWAIPVLGFVGTVLAIAQALAGFVAFLATGAQAAEAMSAALAKVTSGLAFAFETTLFAVLLAAIVTAVYLLVQNRERGILRAGHDFCLSRLLPLLRQPIESGNAENGTIAAEVAHLVHAMAEFTANQREASTAILESLRSAPAAGGERFESRPENYEGNGRQRTVGPAFDFSGWDARAPLEELRETIRQVTPVLRRLAEDLRQQAQEGSYPISVKFPASRPASQRTEDL